VEVINPRPPSFFCTSQEDVVLCNILDKMQPLWVISYHEHDSLLEHIDNEELSEDERKAAWEGYGQKKKMK
jgi:transcriptional regulator ATRX